MDHMLDPRLLVKGLGKKFGPFIVKDIYPDENDPTIIHCHIRSSTFKKFYNRPEHDQGLSIGFDVERKLMGFYIRVFTDVPTDAYEWGVDYLNERTREEVQFVQTSVEPVADADGLDCLVLECSYQLATLPFASPVHQKALSNMIKDVMCRLYTEAYDISSELDSAYEIYLKEVRN